MLEYWMGRNETGHNGSNEAIEGLLQNPGSAILFGDYPRWLLEFAACCCILFMLIGIPGNLITLAALFRTKKLRNATAIFIMNLSISDLMFCCFNLPLATSTFWHGSWRHGPLLCRLFPLLRYGLVAVSLFTILAITINRYIMIGHPRFYPSLYKQSRLVPMILSTWLFGFGVLIVTWFEKWGRFGLDPAIGSCSILPDVHGRSPKEFLFVFAFLTPCISIIVCYARIFDIVRKTASKSRRRLKSGRRNFVDEEAHIASPKLPDHELSVPDGRQLSSTLSLNQNSPEISKSREESFSSNQQSWEQEPTRTEEEAEEETRTSRTEDGDPPESPGTFTDSFHPHFRLRLDDIPFADEREGSESREHPDSIQIPRIPLNRASIVPEGDLWVRRASVPVDDQAEHTTALQLGDSTAAGERKTRVQRRESRFRNVGRARSSEALPRMSSKDRKLLMMILVIFSSFLVCYLPITVTKIFKDSIDWRGLNIAGYILIYLTTCINPVVYVVMSSEYRSAYKNVLLCRSDSSVRNKPRKPLR